MKRILFSVAVCLSLTILPGTGILLNDDPAAATINTWTEWRIPLQAFADQGINLADVSSIAIGFGSKGGVAAGGTGTVYIDDIRLYQPTP